jgi:hypothetical protein
MSRPESAANMSRPVQLMALLRKLIKKKLIRKKKKESDH